jgi:hypothetical protein
MDFDENEIRGSMTARDIGGSFVPKDYVVDYTFAKDANYNWQRGEVKELVSNVLAQYEQQEREKDKPREDPKKSIGFILIPDELHYEATKNSEVLVLHTYAMESRDYKPKLTGFSHVFIYRREGNDKNIDVLRIRDSDNKLSVLETFAVGKKYSSSSYRKWGILRRNSRSVFTDTPRRKKYLNDLVDDAQNVGYKFELKTEPGYVWNI